MHHDAIRRSRLTTAHLADACLRLGIDLRIGPPNLAPLHPSMRLSGPARPVRHFGSVDVFLEAIDAATPGDVLVIDNAGRHDEACIGDLVAIEAQHAGLAGIVVWGLHRDTAELTGLGLPVFSLGATPAGPTRLDRPSADAFVSARVGKVTVTSGDWVVGDADGVLFLQGEQVEQVITTAVELRDREQEQAAEVRRGRSLRQQLAFDEYRRKAARDPGYTLRRHLLEVGGAIET